MKPPPRTAQNGPLRPPGSAALVAAALREDLGRGDLTTRLTVGPGVRARAVLVARRAGVASGLTVFASVFRRLDPRVRVRLLVREGRAFPAQAVLATLQGPARALLSGERVALNFAQRLCGVATLTRAFVRAAHAASRRVAVLDTRKTTPLLRALEKYAVACGGGAMHRRGLFDAVLIKDNHIKAAGSVAAAVRRARPWAACRSRSKWRTALNSKRPWPPAPTACSWTISRPRA